MTNELRYSSGLTLNELNSKVDKLWSQLWDDPRMQQEAAAAGIDLSTITRIRTDVVTLRREGAGIDPVSTAIVVAFAPVIAKIARDIWERILLPKILQDKGKDTLVKK